MPHLDQLAAKHRDAGLVVIGVHTTKAGERMREFVAENGIHYPVAIDVDERTTKAFAVDSWPDYYLIDRKGVLRVADCANAGVDAAVATLLAEPVPPEAAKPDATAAKPDAVELLVAARAQAKASGRHVLVHVHGPG